MRSPALFVVAAAVVCCFTIATASPFKTRSRSPLELLDIIVELEEPCVRQGGLCMRIEDCDPDNLVQVRGVLCPMQSHQGVECCYT